MAFWASISPLTSVKSMWQGLYGGWWPFFAVSVVNQVYFGWWKVIERIFKRTNIGIDHRDRLGKRDIRYPLLHDLLNQPYEDLNVAESISPPSTSTSSVSFILFQSYSRFFYWNKEPMKIIMINELIHPTKNVLIQKYKAAFSSIWRIFGPGYVWIY